MEKEEIKININIDQKEFEIAATISLISGKEPIAAFVTLDFGFLKVKGCRVKWVDFNKDGNLTLVFDLPAYRAGVTFIKSVYIPDKRIYAQISNSVVAKVKDLLNGNSENVNLMEENEIDLDEINRNLQ